MIRRCLPLAALLALGACSALTGTKEPFTTYAPRYTAPADAAKGAPVSWQLGIDTPLASDALDTPRMLVMPTPGALETYKGGRWSDTAPQMLRGLLIQAFQDSGRIAGVGATASGLHADFALSIDLHDFETQYRDGGPHAVIRLNAKLSDLMVNRVRAARAFEADEPVGGAEAADAAAAFERALGKLLPEMVAWTLEQGSANFKPTE
ncbi:MAG TPA: ABC-type transport auxiliary lipoprotein family protein [Rhodanobacteraceae bacterium]|nr:ABC-type transport auxiliary lipoprotein family protein [Rhodanobacteraceae bacterium]